MDIRLSFDAAASEARARRIIDLYETAGVPRSRVLIKLAGTWEGVRAAEGLQKDGICCNITLVFGYCQAVAAAQAGATLISPFPGRGEGFSGGGGTEAVCECVCVWLRHRQGRHFTLTGGRGGVSFLGGGVRGTLISPFPGRGEGGRSFVIMSSMQVV